MAEAGRSIEPTMTVVAQRTTRTSLPIDLETFMAFSHAGTAQDAVGGWSLGVSALTTAGFPAQSDDLLD
jgi:hypothetical protein